MNYGGTWTNKEPHGISPIILTIANVKTDEQILRIVTIDINVEKESW